MRNSQPDDELLEQFAKSRDEAAFRALAERYSGLIFHTALRTLGERTLAEDVSQRVLGALAKKAAQVSRSQAPLPSWLHRTTILEAKSARRSESRHHRKKQAFMHAPADFPAAESSAWKEALPHLDAAIDSLPEADRHVLLLHFINEMTFPEIAARVGKSAAAVQKQSRRALETLQRILGRRGVTLSIVLLTAGLTAEMAKAAPFLAIPSLATLSTLGKTTTSAIAVKKSTCIALGTTLLLCGIPLARQQASIRELESRSQQTADVSRPDLRRRRSVTAAGMNLPERLARDLKAKDRDVPRYRGAVEFLEESDDEALISLIKATTVSPMSADDRIVLLGTILEALADRNPETGRVLDPEKALDAMMDHLTPDLILGVQQTHGALSGYMRSLSETDGARALAWFNGHLDQIRAIPEMRGASKAYLEGEMRIGLAYGLIFSNPAEAATILRPLRPQEIINAFDQLIRSVEPSLRKDAAGFIQVTRELLPEKEATEVVANLIHVNFANTRFASIDILLEKHEFTAGETDAILEKTGAVNFEQAIQAPGGLEKAISEYKTWLQSRNADAIDRRVGESLGKAVKSWSRTGEPIYQTMLRSETMGLGDDAIVGLLETAGFNLGMEKSGQLAAMLSDPEAARALVLKIQKGSAR